MQVELLTYTPNPEEIVAAAAKLCYSKSDIATLLDNMTPEKTEAFIKKLTSMGHESPFEHITFTFGIEDVSRSLLAQITRHRIASYSVQSQRYVHDDFARPMALITMAAAPAAAAMMPRISPVIEKPFIKKSPPVA